MEQTKQSCWNKFWKNKKLQKVIVDAIVCFLAEVIGTALLVFLGCMGCVITDGFSNSHLQMSLNFGLVVLVAIQCFGCVSGAHINPTVTTAAFIYKILSAPVAILYICGQMLGSVLGYWMLMVLLPESSIKVPDSNHNVCVTVPHYNVSTTQGLAIEFIISAVLVIVCCAVWDPRNAQYFDSIAIRFGLTIVCLGITAGPFTGASMNPARSFAPAFWNHDFEQHWIYWVGPLLGSVVASLCYKIVFRREVKKEEEQEDETGTEVLS